MMSTNDISSSIITLPKRPKSQKYRAHSHNHSSAKSRTEEVRITRTMTATNLSVSQLPNFLAKASIFSSTPETMLFKRYRSPQKHRLPSSSPKLERQSTMITPRTHLPTFYTLTSDDDQKRVSEFRRRQIYALNHLMRELEQTQFREFCKSQSIGTDKGEIEEIDKLSSI